MTTSTRRAALGAILAGPLAGIAVAASPSKGGQLGHLPDMEAQFLSLAPMMLPKLAEFDRLWAEAGRLYRVAESSCPRPDPEFFNCIAEQAADRRMIAAPAWRAYMLAREPVDELDNLLDEIVSPFMNLPMTSFPAILLKYRIGMTLGQYEDDAISDIGRLAEELLCT